MKKVKVEATEATTSASSGAYSTPAFIPKGSKNWRGGKKPIYKGVVCPDKKECLTFPYCNQGAGAVDYPKKNKRKSSSQKCKSKIGFVRGYCDEYS